MKAKDRLNNVERGKLLADLFPNEVQGILNAIPTYYKILIENEEEIRKNWDSPLIAVGLWYRLAEGINEIIEKEADKLLKSKRFSDELFYGYNAFFTIDCIVKYADKERNGSSFHYMVMALFTFE